MLSLPFVAPLMRIVGRALCEVEIERAGGSRPSENQAAAYALYSWQFGERLDCVYAFTGLSSHSRLW